MYSHSRIILNAAGHKCCILPLRDPVHLKKLYAIHLRKPAHSKSIKFQRRQPKKPCYGAMCLKCWHMFVVWRLWSISSTLESEIIWKILRQCPLKMFMNLFFVAKWIITQLVNYSYNYFEACWINCTTSFIHLGPEINWTVSVTLVKAL